MKKQLLAYERIDDLFRQIFINKDSGELEKFLKFTQRMPQHAPFNNTLVFAQNPDCFYFATAKQWQDRFRRTIKKGSHPMVILFPFGPIEFVYSYSDTEGAEVTNEDLLHWWREEKGCFDEGIIKRSIANCEKIGIRVGDVGNQSYLRENSTTTMGFAARDHHGNREIRLHPRYTDENYGIEKYGVLCHEIAHHLLGHLGDITIKKRIKGRNISKSLVHQRILPRDIEELEAELTAWLVFDMYGIEKRSASYMAMWFTDQKDIDSISMSEVLKVAGKVRDMGLRKINW